MQTASPRPIRFVMYRAFFRRWYLRRFLDPFGVIPISRDQSRKALDTIARLLNAGEVVCLFPEEYISRTGQLGEFKWGFELVATKVAAARAGTSIILPFYLHGLWGSTFSFANARRKAQRRRRRERELVVAWGIPLFISATAAQVKQSVSELSISAWQTAARILPTLPEVWLRSAAGRRGRRCVLDATGTALSNRRFMAAVFLFCAADPQAGAGTKPRGTHVRRRCRAIANMAVLLTGRTVVNLNYTAGREALRAGMENAGIRNVITARRFLSRLKERGLDLSDLFAGIALHDMEELKAGIGKAEGLLMLTAASILPAGWAWRLFGRRAAPEDTTAILFSSGSEGAPKGVELTHRNLIADVRQIADLLALETDDRVLPNLPLFHAFGLTVTCFLSLLECIPMVCYPDPTDALGCAKAIPAGELSFCAAPSPFCASIRATNTSTPPCWNPCG